MKYITQESELINSNKMYVLYFYSNWMPFNKKMVSVLENLENKYPNISFQAIDVDYFKNMCIRFNIQSIPTILIFDSNKELKRIVGLVLASAMKRVFHDICKV